MLDLSPGAEQDGYSPGAICIRYTCVLKGQNVATDGRILPPSVPCCLKRDFFLLASLKIQWKNVQTYPDHFINSQTYELILIPMRQWHKSVIISILFSNHFKLTYCSIVPCVGL